MRLLLVLALLLAACATERERLELLAEPDPQEGAASYRRSCAPCHGVDGRGDTPAAHAFANEAPDLSLLAADHGGVYPRKLVVDTIVGDHPVDAHGTREMPVWSQRYGPITGATAAAALWARRRVELLADYVGTLQRTP